MIVVLINTSFKPGDSWAILSQVCGDDDELEFHPLLTSWGPSSWATACVIMGGSL